MTIGNSVTSIGNAAFQNCNIPTIVSLIENLFPIYTSTFSLNTFKNATLYVPVGAIEKYKTTGGWKEFLFIEEGTGGTTPPTPQKCEKPTISYQNGKLTFSCETDGAVCHSTITNTDIKSYSDDEVELNVTYNISVYATKLGYENSETATATLCWIDVEPKTEGIENGVAQVRANAVMIQVNDGVVSVSGVDDGTNIAVYAVDGRMAGATTSSSNQATVITSLRKGEMAIVKIGDNSVKVIMQ
ncbi:MAG: hypothetical protein IJ527_04965 [Prevotella sp.]|nr:hypothetical protein [Prevotella sp.]